jgi:hypothetical protein
MPGAVTAREPQAKGVWFVTARRQLAETQGEELVQRVAAHMGDEHAYAIIEPLAGTWYPETAFQRAMAAVADELCEGDPERFVDFIEACTVQGINRFLRIILSMTSPAYVLAKMPVFWARHRQHNGRLHVEIGEQRARLDYTGFPFFDDRNYRLFVRGVLRKTLEVSSGVRPEVTVRDYAADRLLVDVYFPTLKLRT